MRLVLALFLCIALLSLTAAQVNEGGKSTSSTAPRPFWGTYGLEINNTPGNTSQQNPKAVSSGDSSYIIVWEDGRGGYTNLYAQKINESGNRLWNVAGITIAKVSGNQTYANLVEDGAGGAILVWQDYRNGNTDIYVQRISSQGEVLWGNEGIPVCKAPAGQFAPELISDGAGGGIIVWYDYRSGTGEDLYAQRVDHNGNPLWKVDGIPVCEAAGTQWYPKIIRDGTGGAIIVWTDGRGSPADNNIYGQRVEATGKSLWGKDGLPICAAPQNQEHPVILEVEGGAIVAWNDSRSGNTDIYAQKINLAGQTLWNKDGIAITAAPYSQENAQLAPDGKGGAVIVWTDNRGEESAVFFQKVSANGTLDWEEKPVAISFAKQENPQIIKTKGLAWVIFWEDYRAGIPLLFALKINNFGKPLWQEGGIPLTSEEKPQEKATILLSPNDGVFAAWQDRRNGNYDIYSQKLSPEGNILWGEKGIVICDTIGSVIHQNANMIDDGRGNVILVFEDARSGYFNIYVQKISKEGVLLWGKNGISIAKIKADQANPQLASDGSGGAIVVWEDRRNPNFPKIFAQRISPSGKREWENGSISLTKIDSRQSRPIVVPDGRGGAIIIWEDERSPLSLKDLYGQRISGKGELLWNNKGVAICPENGDQAETAIISDGKNGAIVAWIDYRRGERNPDIYAQRTDPDGNLVWQKDGVLICGAPDVQRNPSIARDDEGGAIITWTDRGSGNYDIYAQRINLNGQTLWTRDGIPICQAARSQQNSTIDGHRIVIWEDYRYGNWDIFANALSSQGKTLWGEDGVKVVSVPLTQHAPQIVSWENKGVVVAGVITAWEDYRSGNQYQIFIQRLNPEGKAAWQNDGVLVKTTDGARSPKILALPKENALIVVWEDFAGGGKAIYGQRFTVD